MYSMKFEEDEGTDDVKRFTLLLTMICITKASVALKR